MKGRHGVGLALALAFGCGNSAGNGSTDPPREPGGIEQSAPTEQNGVVSRSSGAMPGGLPTACEISGHDRFTADANTDWLPMRSYFAACATDTDEPRMLLSVTLVDDSPRPHHGFTGAPPEDTRVGAIFETKYDPATRSLVRTGNDIVLDQCDEAHGIAASEDCTRIAVLCQRYDHASTHESFTKDLTLGRTGWITQPDNFEAVNGNANLTPSERQDRYRVNGEMWLLEWNGGSFSETPDAYVVNKAVAGSHLGNNSLLYVESDNSYGAHIFASVFDGNGGRHSGDTFIVIERDGWTISSDRGWTWQCGIGHTLHNRPVFHPDTGLYYSVCTTDWHRDEAGPGAGFWVKPETSSATIPGWQFDVTWSFATRAWGGTHTFLPVDDGLLGVVVGRDDITTGPPPEGFQGAERLEIGIVSMGDDAMELREHRWTRWVAADPQYSLGHPQLASLGQNQYLLGYGRMRDTLSEERGAADHQVPWSYFVQRVDGAGEAIDAPVELEGVGWGEQDQWIALGEGRVAWAFRSDPTLVDRRNAPACSADELQLSVYHAP